MISYKSVTNIREIKQQIEKKPCCSSHQSEFVVFHGGDCETVAVVGGESQSSGVALMMPGAGF